MARLKKEEPGRKNNPNAARLCSAGKFFIPRNNAGSIQSGQASAPTCELAWPFQRLCASRRLRHELHNRLIPHPASSRVSSQWQHDRAARAAAKRVAKRRWILRRVTFRGYRSNGIGSLRSLAEKVVLRNAPEIDPCELHARRTLVASALLPRRTSETGSMI